MIKKLYNFLIALMAMGITMSGISNAQVDLTKIKEQLPKLLGATNQGTEFVLAFHPAWQEVGLNNGIKIYISSSVETDVRLTIPYFSDQPYKYATTKPNDIIEIKLLPDEAQPYTRGNGGLLSTLKHTQVWLGRGIIIESDAPIIVYGMSRYPYTSDGFLAIPTHALDKKYIVSSYRESGDFKNQSLTPYVSIVGIYDKTNVTFSFGGNNNSKIIDSDHGNKEILPGQSMGATLNRGDDWLIASEGAYSDLGGSMVTANKPVSVISGNHCALIPTEVGTCDFIIEQEYPMNAWGRKYHVTPITKRERSSEIRLFAKEAHTKFYRDYDTLNPFFENTSVWGIEGSAWQSYRASTDSNIGMVVTANKPIEVVQYNPGIEDDGIDSDPFQMMLIPEEQFSNDIIFNTPGIRGGFGFNNNYINIVYKSDSKGQIPDDLELGDVVPYTGVTNWKKLKDWSSEPGDSLKDPDYINSPIKVFSKTIRLPYDAVWRLHSPTQKIMAYAYGSSWGESYGFATSAVIADLEKPDTVAPVPYYTQLCDGTTDTINGNYPYVIEMPDDVYLRSNMASIIFDRNNSHNYGFDIKQIDKGWVPGEQRTIRWKAWVLDQSQDGEAIITFADRAGNDTTILIKYIGVKLTITPTNLDFGNLKIGEEKTQEFTLKNKSQREVKLSELSLQSMRNELESQGFSIVIPFDINVPMGIEESRTFLVKFKATKEGKFRDSVGVGDSCFYQYKSLVQASVGTPIIHVSDVDFGDRTVGVEGSYMIATVQNTGTTTLAITGYTGPTLGVYRTDLGDLNISATNPWIIGVQETAQFRVWFKPDAEKSYPDSIVFISDAGREVDPVCEITGRGIRPQLQVTGENWGPKRVHLPKYDTYTYQTFGYPYPSATGAIVLSNPGSKEVTINQINVIEDLRGSAFEIVVDGKNQPLINYVNQIGQIKDDQGRTITTIPAGESRHIAVYFHPTTSGVHKLVIEYVSDSDIKPTTTLEGIGIYPKIVTEDVDYGVNVVGDQPIIKTMRFTNEQWEYQDSLVLQGFTTNPNGSISAVFNTPSSEGFSYDGANILDRTGNAITIPHTLQPGEYVELTGQYSAQKPGDALGHITSISDASVDAESEWKGFGIQEDMKLTGGAEPYICYNTSDEIVVTLENNGSSTIVIPANSISVINDSKGYFNIARVINSANQVVDQGQEYDFAPGDKLTIVVGYNPVNWTATNKVDIVNADVQVITDAVTPSLKVLSIPISGRSVHYNRTTSSLINGKTEETVEPGQNAGAGYKADAITYSIYVEEMNGGQNLDLTGPTQFTVKINYKKNFLAIKEDGSKNMQISVGADMPAGWKIDNTSRKFDKATNIEEVTVVMSGTIPFQSGARSELLEVEFLAFLPYYIDPSESVKEQTIDITHEIMDNEQCVDFTNPEKSTAILSEVCLNPLRPILISAVDYNMGKINPQPIGDQGATLDFAVGLEGQTSIRIINSNGEVVSVLTDGSMKVGNYSVRIPVEKLTSGVYFVEMQSGEFKEMQKIVVQK